MVPTGLALAGRLVLVGLVCLAAAGRLEAAPYYTATYIGPANDYMQQSGTITNLQAGISYPFATTTTPITDADLQNRPSGTMQQGHDYPEMIPYRMNVQAINSSGTAIGAMPVDAGLSDPWEQQALGYAVRSADGQYSPFTTLIYSGPQKLDHRLS